MKKVRLWIVGILVLGAAILFIGRSEVINAYFSGVKLQFLANYTNKYYLYDFEEQMSIEGIYSGYLEGLDNRVTYYLEDDDLKAASAEMRGNYYGVGLKLAWSLDGHSLTVTKVISESPAERAGIEVGDQITQVEGIKVLPSNEKEVVEKAFSNANEPITFVVEHNGQAKEIVLIPEEVNLEEMTVELMDTVMYIHLHTIKEGTSMHLKEKIDAVDSSLYQTILLDLRGLETHNLEEVCRISDLFLEEGIAFKEKTKEEKVEVFTTEAGAYDKNLAILMNSTTLAGAEALVLALEEKATLYGSETGGLFYIKTLVGFEDGTGMSVASGKICDRYGKQLSEEGIEPDERLYLDEESQLDKLSEGYILKEEDSYLKAVLKKYQ